MSFRIEISGWELVVIIVLVILAFNAKKVRLVLASGRWPTTAGILLHHAVSFAKIPWWQERSDGARYQDPDRYVIRVRYAYTVDGVKYESERLTAWGSNKIGHSREVEDWIRTLPTLQHVPVFYNPRRPWECALLPGLGHVPGT